MLGITTHHDDAQNGDQEALIELLMKVKLNMDAALETEITDKGMAPATIAAIIAQADILNNANITQETLKGSRPEITAEAVTEFNAIYSAVISVAKIARNFFKGDEHKQDLFSYAKVLSNLNSTPPAEPEPPLANKNDEETRNSHPGVRVTFTSFFTTRAWDNPVLKVHNTSATNIGTNRVMRSRLLKVHTTVPMTGQ